MATTTEDKYTFPDEIGEDGPSKNKPEDLLKDIKIEVIDDTPPEDKGRQPLPKDIVEDLEKDDLDEYGEKVKKRLSQMKKVWHDERRAKETAAREKEEALRFAQQYYQENQQLRKRLGTGEDIFIKEVTKAANTEVAAAKEKLKKALESGDVDKVTDAQEALFEAKSKQRDMQGLKPTLQTDGTSVETKSQTSAPTAPPVDPKAKAWMDENKWFGTDEEMTALALGLHEKLVRAGVDPRSEDYYQRVNETMRKRFPENFEEEGKAPSPEKEKTSPRKAATTIVAPATRSTASKTIRLTSSEASIAKRLGITNEAYARDKMKLESNNG
jgi:hypothetical protein